MKMLKFRAGSSSVYATYLREGVPGAGNWLVIADGVQKLVSTAIFTTSYKAPGRGDAKVLFKAAAEGTEVPVGSKPYYKFRGKVRSVQAMRVNSAESGMPVGSWMVIDENSGMKNVSNEVFVKTYKAPGRGPAHDAFKLAVEQAAQAAPQTVTA